jgi:hypothetical protein
MKSSYAKFIRIAPFVIAVLSVSLSHAQQVTVPSFGMKWMTAPASLPQGAKLAILEGDLTKPGALAFRLKLPAGYQLKPHSSPAIDRLIVISGTFNLGSGNKFDTARTIPMSAGYVHWPDKGAYFGWATEETIIEYQGVGPFAVSYVNAGDDPARKTFAGSSVTR